MSNIKNSHKLNKKQYGGIEMANKIAKFFLGENTPNGFKTFFHNR